MMIPLVTFGLASLLALTLGIPVEEYDKARSEMLQADRATQMGSSLTLNQDEKIVSQKMMKEKSKLMEASRVNREDYFPAWSYYRSKPLMEETFLFKLIQKMPKGGALHLHDPAITSIDWLVKNATYRDNLYMCVDKKTWTMQFVFHKTNPKNTADCHWTLVADERKAAVSAQHFDESIKKNMSLLATDPLVTYPTITKVWDKFSQYFGSVRNIIFYKPVLRDYFRQALTEFYTDNVQYMEIRSLFTGMYDLEGKVYGEDEVFQIYREVTEEFKQNHPDFIGAKFIMSPIRFVDKDVVLNDVKKTMAMREEYPDFMIGFDLVGQEDPLKPLIYYKDSLLYPSQQDPSNPLPYFFHAAETDFQGTATDYNLIDAVLLNTTRIGHGYALAKHPSLAKEIRQKGIAIEVNPISNQVLGLVRDLRNHMMVPMMAEDFPVVISSDDPVAWEALPLSSDFYVAYMNMCGEDNDLRFLKQLAINSIKYSAMKPREKEEAMQKWQKKWNLFIEQAKNGDLQYVAEKHDSYFSPTNLKDTIMSFF